MKNRSPKPDPVVPQHRWLSFAPGGRWVPLALAVLVFGGGILFYDWYRAVPRDRQPTFVGRQSCAQCHPHETALFAESHHDRAMDLATERTVLADFSDVSQEHLGVTSRFFRDGDRFMVRTEGEDGKLADFHVKYVFGVEPLQQYMVEFDRPPGMPENEISRVQVLRWSWDTQAKRWFHLDPPDVKERLSPDDDLHWTGIAQRWQTMCAECHSTNLEKNFDVKTARYHTTFSEIDVSCEACHGPASIHVELASSRSIFWDRNWGYGLPVRLKGKDAEPQLQTCAHCHSRRQLLDESFSGGQFWSAHDLERLQSDTYFDDGQIKDEVYEYGSFLQSRMYHKGIRCSDCHDPHSARLKHEGNQVCTSCHQHPAGKYDSPSHHHHKPGTEAALCVNCHMPSRTYMDVDPRRDHSFRIPRPDLSLQIGTPNACTGCHVEVARVPEDKRSELTDYARWMQAAEAGDASVRDELTRANQWCDAACDRWYGSQRRKDPHFATALAAARKQSADGETKLREVATDQGKTPAIARASALQELARLEPGSLWNQLKDDPHPMVRATAASLLRGRTENDAIRSLTPLLNDPSRLVRIRAVQGLLAHAGQDASAMLRQFKSDDQESFHRALEELHLSLMPTNDRAGSHLTWAVIQEGLGNVKGAIESYETAIRVEPRFVGSRSNLAELLESLIERQALTAAQIPPVKERIAALRREELVWMERDARLGPQYPELQFRLGQMRYLAGQGESAIEPIEKAIALNPEEPRYRYFLALLFDKLGNLQRAIETAEALQKGFPDVAEYRELLRHLRETSTVKKD